MLKPSESDPQTLRSDVDPEPASKSQLKRDAKAVLILAARLLDARQSDIARLGLPDHIQAIIAEGRTIKRFGARKRHTQYLAKLLRNEADVAEIQHRLDQSPGAIAAEPATESQTAPEKPIADSERVLAQLLSNPDLGFKRLREDYPTLELQRVSRLLRQMGSEDPTRPERSAAQAKARQSLLDLLQSHGNNSV